MAKKTRRKFSSEFIAKVVLEALRERSTIEELARKHELHPNQINTWKKEAVANMSSVFGADKSDGAADHEKQTEKLYAQIGQLKVENVTSVILFRYLQSSPALHFFEFSSAFSSTG